MALFKPTPKKKATTSSIDLRVKKAEKGIAQRQLKSKKEFIGMLK